MTLDTLQQSYWLTRPSGYRYFIAFALSLLVMAVILLLPIHWNFTAIESGKSLKLSRLIEAPVTNNQPSSTQELNQEVTKSQPPANKPRSNEAVVDKQSKPVVQFQPSSQSQTASPATQSAGQPNPNTAGDIFNSAYGKVHTYQLDEEFKPATGEVVDYRVKPIQPSKLYTVTKIIDEEKDKPQVRMNFYSEGIWGVSERFFEKISYGKVFTTKYGLKIACGGVGPLVMCSWK